MMEKMWMGERPGGTEARRASASGSNGRGNNDRKVESPEEPITFISCTRVHVEVSTLVLCLSVGGIPASLYTASLEFESEDRDL